ncbi:hypothetical protein Tco_1263332 [Tanacetum coccineum]
MKLSLINTATIATTVITARSEGKKDETKQKRYAWHSGTSTRWQSVIQVTVASEDGVHVSTGTFNDDWNQSEGDTGTACIIRGTLAPVRVACNNEAVGGV